MKTTLLLKNVLLGLILTASISACKKDKKTDPAPQPVEVKALTITELKALSTSASVKIPDGRKFKGIVISDASAKNIDSKTVVLQEAADKPGIIVTFDAAQTFAIGDEVEVVVSNQTIAQVNGEILLQNLPATNAKKVGTGNLNAKVTTAADVIKNAASWNGTLVTLPTGNFTGNGKYSGTLTYIDATGSIKSQVIAGAAIENQTYPVTLQTLTGIVRVKGNDVFVNMRNAADAGQQAQPYTFVEDFSDTDQSILWGNGLRSFEGQMTPWGQLSTNFTTNVMYDGNYATSFLTKIKTANGDANDSDNDLMSPGKNYYLNIEGGNPGRVIDNGNIANSFTFSLNGGEKDDPKTVGFGFTIVFAGSKTTAKDYPELNSGSFKNLVFKPVSDQTVAYKVVVSIGNFFSQTVLAESATFHDVGVWHSVTMNIKNEDLKGDAGNYIFITIQSTKIRGTVVNWEKQSNGEPNDMPKEFVTPILVDKIIFNYPSKPVWAK